MWLWTNSRLITDTPMTVTLAVDSSWSGYGMVGIGLCACVVRDEPLILLGWCVVRAALSLGGRLEQNAPLAATISGAAACALL